LSKLNKRNPIARAIKVALLATASVSAFTTSAVFAEEEDAAEESKITITGSRIKRTDMEGANPVQVLSAADIKLSGIDNVGDLLQEIPAVAGAATNTAINNGGSGAVRVSLRGLGAQYTLVLLNGRRIVASGTGANSTVDLGNIPTSIIERVEILKDGASAIYGSDAIGGVVNIITKSDFEGAEFNISHDESTHDGDGGTDTVDFTIGTSSSKGSVVISAYYSEQQAQWSGDRDWSKFDLGLDLETNERIPGGSSAPPWSRLNGVNSFNPANFIQDTDENGAPLFNDDGTPVMVLPDGTCNSFTHGAANGPGQSDPTDFANPTGYNCWDWGVDTYNFAPANYHLTPNERYGIFASANYELTEDLRFFTELAYNNRSATTKLAPIPLAPLAFFGQSATYSADNYYNQQFGPTDLNGDTVDIADWRRRVVETGGRDSTFTLNNTRIVVGLEGELFQGDWGYEVSYIYGSNQSTTKAAGGVNFEKVALAVGPSFLDATSGEVVCGTEADPIAGCTSLNIFGIPGSDTQITQAMLDYISFEAHDIGTNEQQIFSASIGGEAFELPAGPVGVAAGIEHREESGADFPDALIALGITSGSSRTSTVGKYEVDEVYFETKIPLLADAFLAQSLNLDLAVRYSDYDTFGNTTNHKIGIEWRPNENLLIRGTQSTAFRAPSTSDLFAGTSDNSPEVVDPCNNNPTAFCIADGVPAAGFEPIGDQLSSTRGGNPDLQPEEADTFTLGFVYTPDFVDGLELTVDYWDIELTDAISTIGEQVILNQCAASGLNCDLITRHGPGSVLYGNSSDIDDRTTNVGGVESQGFDMNVRYALETDIGKLRFNLDTTFYDTYDKTLSDGSVVSHAGRFIRNGGDGNFPEWKTNLNVNMTTNDWQASWTMRYIGSVEEQISFESVDLDDADLDTNAEIIAGLYTGYRTEAVFNTDGSDSGVNVYRDIDEQIVHDIRFTYFFEGYSVSVGIDNVFDEDPPYADTGFNDNTDPRTYNTQGRHWSLGLSASF